MTGVFWFFYCSFFFLPSREQRQEKTPRAKTLFGDTDDARFRGATTFGRGGIDIWKLLVTHTTPSHRRRRHHLAVSGASLRGDQNQRPHECVQLKKINIYPPPHAHATAATRIRATCIFVCTKYPCVVVPFPIARAHLWRRCADRSSLRSLHTVRGSRVSRFRLIS